MQNGAKSPSKLWHTSKDPPADCVAVASLELMVAIEPSVAVAINAAGAALSVVATPFIVVGTGVTVEALPLASTVTHGFRADSVIAMDN